MPIGPYGTVHHAWIVVHAAKPRHLRCDWHAAVAVMIVVVMTVAVTIWLLSHMLNTIWRRVS